MDGIDLVGRRTLLRKYRLECFYKLVVVMYVSKVTLKFAHESSCYRSQFLVRPQCLLAVLRVVAETLIAEGCDVLFAAAGQSGNGVLTAVKEANGIWFIGCDVDQ